MTALADALAQKSARLERCVRRAREELAAAADFMTDFSRQDAAILNVQRACELAIDMGNMVIAAQGWALPGSAREVFATLQQEGVIDADLAAVLGRMVGFRNIAVHEYQSLDVAIVVAVIRHELDGLLRFAGLLLSRQFPDSN
ncbi:uncharacterized protein YutE (UPF0331/DUF86 family) [Pseudacidovorax sp. 1753]|jgi:uncharacterized protein YutE (UPF0331/DUF86 family)|uniref:type VII toxin-antitoxin system HepT family RNase toxin n=1 Tax=unclassified Pseudacidovorax TaxID=2620592 RepID=UPI000955D4EC|nr:DUF86 domain-containing protein [Pseudacidovorax sp. RU35E]SIP94969.1 Uncharacterized conserved protein YutE, UPF0331/DUF86 family [Pseudacidovorax sp. RU35E]